MVDGECTSSQAGMLARPTVPAPVLSFVDGSHCKVGGVSEFSTPPVPPPTNLSEGPPGCTCQGSTVMPSPTSRLQGYMPCEKVDGSEKLTEFERPLQVTSVTTRHGRPSMPYCHNQLHVSSTPFPSGLIFFSSQIGPPKHRTFNFYLYALQLLPLTLYSETANPYQPASSVF